LKEEFPHAFLVQCKIRVHEGTMYKLFNEPDITKYININRLRWAGHIIHTENSRTVKKVSGTRPEGTRKTGRPTLRWEDGVVQDIRQGPESEDLEECGYGYRRLAETPEEGQGPHWHVKPMMMMMMIASLIRA
jgi:hypothetical protein